MEEVPWATSHSTLLPGNSYQPHLQKLPFQPRPSSFQPPAPPMAHSRLLSPSSHSDLQWVSGPIVPWLNSPGSRPTQPTDHTGVGMVSNKEEVPAFKKLIFHYRSGVHKYILKPFKSDTLIHLSPQTPLHSCLFLKLSKFISYPTQGYS